VRYQQRTPRMVYCRLGTHECHWRTGIGKGNFGRHRATDNYLVWELGLLREDRGWTLVLAKS
jgi:hypothetical protein